MLYTTRIERAVFDEGRRVIAVSDVHGHLRYLRRLLEKVRFGTDDILVIVGDLLERGEESLEALRYVMGLCRTHTVYALLGNVDMWAMDKVLTMDVQALCSDVEAFVSRHGGSLVRDLATELGVEIVPGMDVAAFRKKVRRRFAEEYAFVEGLPTILQTADYTFVHGGIPEGPVDALAGQPARPFLKRDAFMDEGRRMDRWTIVGHWPVCLYERITGRIQFMPVINAAQRIVAIDGGCGIKKEGQLNALMIEAGRFSSESYDELPVRVALDAQAGSQNPRNITYMNGAIDILGEADDFIQVAHRPDGYRMWVPRGCLFDQGGETRCGEITDYRLPVAPGDALRIVMETSRGAVCKKDGVSGWYTGRFAPGEAV